MTSSVDAIFVFVPALCALAAACAFGASAAGDAVDPALLTVAEKSVFRATARYGEVVALLNRLAEASPLARRTSLGRTAEGRDIPAIVLADPPVSTGEESARQAAERGKLVVLAIGNIHAGEVDGKEALPMLARELIGLGSGSGAVLDARRLLDDLVVILAPIYNADGNERVARDNRPGQVGPDEGMGIRENADGFDLNRDFIKLDAPETRGLVGFLNRWDPHLFIDTHTTNGCFHRYVITYEGPKAPASDPEIVRFCRDRMMPEIARESEHKYGVPAFVYGDFAQGHTRWETYPAYARFSTTYVGLRNRLSILTEGYSYATYERRVLGTRDFVRACLEYAAANKDRIRALIADADRRAIEAGRRASEEDRVALRSEVVAAPRRVVAAGFVEEERDGKTVSTGVPKDYDVELWTHYRAALSARRPSAYAVAPELEAVVERLRLHGIETQVLAEAREVHAEVYGVDRVETAAEPFQNRRLRTLSVTARREARRLTGGTVLVSTAQRLGTLACYLLEPQSEDGLATWDLLGEHLEEGADYPILRIVP